MLSAKDGRRIPIEDSAAPIRGAKGDVTGVVLVFRDITQRREAERIEKKAAAELARHSELLERTNAELQHFAYAASHDLREPLRTITAYTQLVQLRSRLQIDKKSAECLQLSWPPPTAWVCSSTPCWITPKPAKSRTGLLTPFRWKRFWRAPLAI